MELADIIANAIAERDKAHNEAWSRHQATVESLNAEFAEAQRELAISFVDREYSSQVEAIRASEAATELMDKIVREAAEEHISAAIGQSRDAGRSADKIAGSYTKAVLVDAARSLGLKVSGTEVEVAQRLIDAGWAG